MRILAFKVAVGGAILASAQAGDRMDQPWRALVIAGAVFAVLMMFDWIWFDKNKEMSK